jgi:hypothetical protein
MDEKITKTDIRLERLENHYEALKNGNVRIEKKVDSISDALLGTEFGDLGFVEKMKSFKDDLERLKKEDLEKIKTEQIKTSIYLSWFIKIYTVTLGATVVILIKYIFKGL